MIFNKIASFFGMILLVFTLGAQNIGIIPTPQEITHQEGAFTWKNPAIFFEKEVTNAPILQAEYERQLHTPVTVATRAAQAHITFHKTTHAIHQSNESYRLRVSPTHIDIEANSDRGLFYGLQSLLQLYRFNYRKEFDANTFVKIPCVEIVDYPAYEKRGWMNDISRGPIPTMDFLKKQIQTMAEFKLNTFTLYTEHTFRAPQFSYAPTDGITAEELRELQDFAAPYYIEIVGNQQCFAHFEKILSQPAYQYLADTKYNLHPGLPETYQFLDSLLQTECKAYDSPLFNINCDETEALGTGKAKEYVEKMGATEAYIRHILRIDSLMRKYGKHTLMWADIVLKDKQIREKLPKDITMLVWSYVPAESFMGLLLPIQEAGFDFWVVPGVSMWSTVFPSMDSYEKNIANFARDGKIAGARGLLNTAWNDSGEALLPSAWHACGWGAEMAWKPTTDTSRTGSESERAARLSTFDTNFNFQFFRFYNNENIITDFLRTLTPYENCSVGELYNTGTLWKFSPLQFLPGNLTNHAHQAVRDQRFNSIRSNQLLKLILSEEALYENSEIIYCALYASNRLFINLFLKNLQFTIYDLYQNPEKATTENKQRLQADIDDAIFYINSLKDNYLQLWDESYRPYWREVNESRYRELVAEMEQIMSAVFIETTLENNQLQTSLRTLFNDLPIYYSINDSAPTTQSTTYQKPLTLTESSLIQTLTIATNGAETRNQKEVSYHKGIGTLREVVGEYSSFRPEYSGGGKLALADGVTGSNDYRDGRWQGYQGQDVKLTYQWEKPVTIDSITVRYLQNFYDWILAPTDIELWIDNGTGKQPAKNLHFPVNQISGQRVGTLQLTDLAITATKLMITIKNPGTLPKEHGACGAPSFIFLDEVIIH